VIAEMHGIVGREQIEYKGRILAGIQPLMARLGTEQANQLLREVAVELGLQSMVRGRCSASQILAARRAFAVQGRKLGITIKTLAVVLGVHRSTIMIYCDPQLRERRNRYGRRYKAMARETRQPGGWALPTWTRIINEQSLERADYLGSFNVPAQWQSLA
jgi:hypothetical protein